ncbi:hypothetical protein MAR_010544 [Mya arenaria]|uniref:Uncharacterized protein n=1 Tax=Mya arenaria TaxID=6604 RepID=A0ABY7EA13_MYAAR|nr:hypothetical protein MAR_010544 [Mya arenaria]
MNILHLNLQLTIMEWSYLHLN